MGVRASIGIWTSTAVGDGTGVGAGARSSPLGASGACDGMTVGDAAGADEGGGVLARVDGGGGVAVATSVEAVGRGLSGLTGVDVAAGGRRAAALRGTLVEAGAAAPTIASVAPAEADG